MKFLCWDSFEHFAENLLYIHVIAQTHVPTQVTPQPDFESHNYHLILCLLVKSYRIILDSLIHFS